MHHATTAINTINLAARSGRELYCGRGTSLACTVEEGAGLASKHGSWRAAASASVQATGDHLGNNRVLFSDRNGDGAVDSTEIIQENHYYAFGLEMKGSWQRELGPEQRYGYNGKEHIEEIGLMDYGARWYDAVVGRWNAVDPLADSYAPWSPYNYVLGNPIKFTDPDGMQVETEIYNQSGKYVGEDKNGDDGTVSIVSNETAKQLKDGDISAEEAIASGQQTTKAVLAESINVLERTIANGGLNEEISVVPSEGKPVRGETGPSTPEGGAMSAGMPAVEGEGSTLIHSHITGLLEIGGQKFGSDANEPTTGKDGDVNAFSNFDQNVIVGPDGPPKRDGEGNSISRGNVVVFFNRSAQKTGKISSGAARMILKPVNAKKRKVY